LYNAHAHSEVFRQTNSFKAARNTDRPIHNPVKNMPTESRHLQAIAKRPLQKAGTQEEPAADDRSKGKRPYGRTNLYKGHIVNGQACQ